VYRKFGTCRICFRKLADQGLIYLPNTTAEFQARIAAETARWAQLIKDNKLEVDQ